MTKQSLSASLDSLRRGPEDLTNKGREESCCLAVQDTTTKKCSSAVLILCETTENPTHCRLCKILLSVPSPLVLQFK